MDLTLKTDAFFQDDQSWLGSAHGTTSAKSITLDTSAFTANTHYPNGYFPSGLALGRIEATGLYGPYSSAAGDGRDVLAGFLFCAIGAPTVNTVDVQGALLDHGKILTAKLPVALADAEAAQISAGTRLIFTDIQPVSAAS